MTKREQHLIILVVVVIAGWMVYRFWPQDQEQAQSGGSLQGNQPIRLEEANRLLRSRQNILVRNRDGKKELKAYLSRFYSSAHPEEANLALLKTVEGLAAQTGLAVQQKNMAIFRDNTIGVSLEGKTGPESLIRFLQLTSQNSLGLRINRLQIHSLPESKQLSYQVTVITLMVKK